MAEWRNGSRRRVYVKVKETFCEFGSWRRIPTPHNPLPTAYNLLLTVPTHAYLSPHARVARLANAWDLKACLGAGHHQPSLPTEGKTEPIGRWWLVGPACFSGRLGMRWAQKCHSRSPLKYGGGTSWVRCGAVERPSACYVSLLDGPEQLVHAPCRCNAHPITGIPTRAGRNQNAHPGSRFQSGRWGPLST